MSTHLECYAVDTEALWKAFGSNDPQLRSGVLSACADQVAEFNEHKPSKAPTFEQVLDSYLAGETVHIAWVGTNREVLRALCSHLGEPLVGDGWSQINADFVEEIGTKLHSSGASFDLWELISSGPPKAIPLTNPYLPDDSADCGFVGAARVHELARWAGHLKADGDEEAYVAVAIAEFKAWFLAASSRGTGLAFFYG